LYEVHAEEDQPVNFAMGLGVAVGAMLIAAAMLFLFRRFANKS
jgi:nitrate reductase gamma subunit